jgi:peptidoglycan/LPS O-acetylase OafA/YrhL
VGQRKIAFADHLRGIAALMVLMHHLVVVYWTSKVVITYYTFSPTSNIGPPAIVRWLGNFDLGAFGVALFFLISGFVIPLSFKRYTTGSFLLARALRIWPTYLAALACGLAVRYASAHFWGSRFHVSSGEMIANVLLVQDLFGSASLDSVNWTLAVEVEFYLLFAVGYAFLLRYRQRVVLYSTCVLPLLLAMQRMLPPHLHLGLSSVRPGICLPFMLIGTLFYLQMESLITLRQMLSAALFSAAAVTICIAKIISPTMTTMSYAAAFAIFLGLFLVRERIGPSRVLAALSAISYPLYLVHCVIGYAVLQLATVGLGFSYMPALGTAIIAAIAVAVSLHFAIERPSMAWGRRLARGRAPPGPLPAASAPIIGIG